MYAFIGVLGILIVIISAVWLIINLIRRKNTNTALYLLAAGFFIFFFALVLAPDVNSPDATEIAAEDPAEEQTATVAPEPKSEPTLEPEPKPEPKPEPEPEPVTAPITPTSEVPEIKPAQNAEELALIVENAIKNIQGVTECFILTYDEADGVVIAAETSMSDANQIWQAAYAGVSAGYLNKGEVVLARIDVNISTPEAPGYSLQVFVGHDHIDEAMLETLKDTTWEEFKAWLMANTQSSEVFLANDSRADLRIQGPLSVDKEAEAARIEAIEAQFSFWDGAHYNLVDAVKEQMHDPKSFRHVETVYWDMQDHIVVRMTFRGTNQFGGVVTNIVKAWIDLNGNIQKWEWH